MASSRPSRWWVAAATVALAGAVALGMASFLVHRDAVRPVGEGELFIAETETIAAIVGGATDPTLAVREARNDLEVEAVSLVDADGTVVASTSDTLVGFELSGMLAFAHGDGRFTAVATPVAVPIDIDGVTTWAAGDTLYSVLRPLGDGRSVLAHYDVSGLLAKRVVPNGLRGPALWLAVAAAIVGLTAAALLLGRERAVARYREAEREADLAKAHSRELEVRNRELDDARAAAERALALAEEKHRIRSEFVLMINHELRTPLTAVTTGARLLEEEHLSAADREAILTQILCDGERLERIIDHVLAVARIENQGLESPVGPVAVDDLVGILGAGLPNAVTVDVAAGAAGLTVATDRQTLLQLIDSLADNALTHGASTTSLRIGPTAPTAPDLVVGDIPDPALHLAVVDDGPGIAPDFLPRVFEKFEKSGFSSGTGLGLYLARLMAEAIDASIAVEVGTGGTTMTVSVPVVAAPVGERVPA